MKKSFIGETLRTILYAVVLALIIRTVVYEPFSIPSGSMYPSLYVGDFLFVSKFSYGYSKYTFFDLIDFEGRVWEDEPQRGDIAVFKLPSDPSIDYIKRIIGLPGDRIQLKEGVLYINNTSIQTERIANAQIPNSYGGSSEYFQFLESLPNGKTYPIYHEPGYKRTILNNTPPWIVPADHYFMLGDNRDNSRDSRFRDIGFIPVENFVGRAEILFFSVEEGRFDLFDQEWYNSIRFDRLWRPIS